jgi:hypothetical protein
MFVACDVRSLNRLQESYWCDLLIIPIWSCRKELALCSWGADVIQSAPFPMRILDSIMSSSRIVINKRSPLVTATVHCPQIRAKQTNAILLMPSGGWIFWYFLIHPVVRRPKSFSSKLTYALMDMTIFDNCWSFNGEHLLRLVFVPVPNPEDEGPFFFGCPRFLN